MNWERRSINIVGALDSTPLRRTVHGRRSLRCTRCHTNVLCCARNIRENPGIHQENTEKSGGKTAKKHEKNEKNKKKTKKKRQKSMKKHEKNARISRLNFDPAGTHFSCIVLGKNAASRVSPEQRKHAQKRVFSCCPIRQPLPGFFTASRCSIGGDLPPASARFHGSPLTFLPRSIAVWLAHRTQEVLSTQYQVLSTPYPVLLTSYFEYSRIHCLYR